MPRAASPGTDTGDAWPSSDLSLPGTQCRSPDTTSLPLPTKGPLVTLIHQPSPGPISRPQNAITGLSLEHIKPLALRKLEVWRSSVVLQFTWTSAGAVQFFEKKF